MKDIDGRRANLPSALDDHHPGQAESHPDAERRACDQKQRDEDEHHHGRDPGMMQRVIKHQQDHQRCHERNQAIDGLRQREASVAIVAERSGKKNRHRQQKQYRRSFGHTALLSLIHWAKNITLCCSAFIRVIRGKVFVLLRVSVVGFSPRLWQNTLQRRESALQIES